MEATYRMTTSESVFRQVLVVVRQDHRFDR
mgnify:FL=1|jgi:hypothetical protein